MATTTSVGLTLNGSLAELDWGGLKGDLAKAKLRLTKVVLAQAKREHVYFGEELEGKMTEVQDAP